MSNDISYRLRFSAPLKKTLEEVKVYFDEKRQRWRKRGWKNATELASELALEHTLDAFTWGFDFEEFNQLSDGSWEVAVTSWANENLCGNFWISGEHGELARMLEIFPEVEVSGTFDGSYGKGEVDGFELCYNHYFEDAEEDDDDSDSWGRNGDAQYNSTTKRFLINIARQGRPITSKDLAQALAKGLEANAWIYGKPLIWYLLKVGTFGHKENECEERTKAIDLLIQGGMKLERLQDAVRLLIVMPTIPDIVLEYLKTHKLVHKGDIQSKLSLFHALMDTEAFAECWIDEMHHELPQNFFELIDPTAHKDQSIVEIATWRSPHLFTTAHKFFRANKPFVLKLLKLGVKLELSHVSRDLQEDRDVVLLAVQNKGYNLSYAPRRLRNEVEIVRAAVANLGYVLKWASRSLRADRTIVATAVANDGCALEFASAALRNDREIVEMAINASHRGKRSALVYASKRLKYDPELLKMIEGD